MTDTAPRRALALLAPIVIIGSAACEPLAGPEVYPEANYSAQSTPNGPWVQAEQNVSLEALRSYEQLWSTLEDIERSAGGVVEVSAAPRQSNTGRSIPVVTIGDGPSGIMIIAQQHGNEYIVSEGMVELVRQLANASLASSEIRDALTVTVVPRVNVDGFDAPVSSPFGIEPPWRWNYDPDECPLSGPCPPFYIPTVGYDINRYHSYLPEPEANPWGADPNPVPEAVATRLLFDQRQPLVVIDYHHQGSLVDEEGDLVVGSTMWPNATATADALGVRPQFDDAVVRSKRVVGVIMNELARYGYGSLTRFPGTSIPGIARNAYGLLGAASVLFEVRGRIGTKSNGYLTQMVRTTAMAVVIALSDGSLESVDPSITDGLSPWGTPIANPH